MKITAVLGSPRKKGDCAKVIEMIEKSFNGYSETNINYIYLSEAGLGFCKSCLLCYTKGENYCPNRDVSLNILEKLMDSDVVIFASPVYEQHITALMKNFYDNYSYLFHRPRFFGKRAIIVSSTGGSGIKETLNYMKMCAIGWGFQVSSVIGVCGPALNGDSNYREQVQNKINVLVNGINKTGASVSPSLYQLAMFRAMQFKALKGAEKKTVEYVYWQERGWLNKNYYSEEKVNVFKRMYSKFMKSLMKTMMNGKRIVAKVNC